MKKLNKLFLAAGSVAAVAAPIAAVVSCGSQQKEDSLPLAKFVEQVGWTNQGKDKVMAFTDGGDRNDQSFNQQTWEAASSFKTDDANDKDTKDEKDIISAASSSASDLIRAYQKANQANTYVMSGFLHSAPLASFSGENADKAFVFVDGAINAQYDKLATDATGADAIQAGTANTTTGYTDFTLPAFANGVVKVETWATPAASAAKQLVEIKATKEEDGSFAAASEYKLAGNTLSVKTTSLKNGNLKVSVTRRQSNIANLNFASEQAGFLAGVAAGTYSLSKHAGEVSVATFGGMAIPSVTSFMNGFVAGAKYVAGSTNTLYVNEQKFDDAFIASDKSKYFVNDFTADLNGKVTTLATQLLTGEHKADVIMPVGGPQEFTALTVIKNVNQDARVIGVDTDMYHLVKNDADRKFVLTSATKYIKEAITQTLEGLYSLQSTSTVVTAKGKDVLGKDYLGGLANNWVGVGTIDSTYATEKAAVEAVKNIGGTADGAWDSTDETKIEELVKLSSSF